MKWRDLSGELHHIMAEQQKCLARLADHVRHAPLTDARVFGLPAVYPEEELIEPDRIDPVQQVGEIARDLALDAYSRFHTGEGLSTRVVWRLPGVVAFETDSPDDITRCVDKINQWRQQFKDVAMSVADEDERYDLLHHAFPGMIYLQVIRQLRVLSGPVDSVTFTFGRKSASELITLASADAKLEWAGRNAPPLLLAKTGLSLNRFRDTVAREREHLATLPPDTPIRWRRQLRVRPLMNIRLPSGDDGGSKPPSLQREANTPLLLMNARHVKLRPMRPYDAERRSARQSRSDQGLQGTPVSRILPLFLTDDSRLSGSDCSSQ